MVRENLRRLWAHPRFRRILEVRISTQAADGTLQVGMASYVLLSPEQQPDAWSIAMVLAITLLPFSLVGPFISLALDRWSRQRILVGTDAIRCLIGIALAFLVWDGARSPLEHATLLVLLLVAMSLNRFLLAALTAGLEHTIDRREYLIASSIMPTIGPLGLMIGAGIAAAVRLLGAQFMPAHQADSLIFAISAVLFAISVGLGARFGKSELGPIVPDRSGSASDVLAGLVQGVRHLGSLPAVRSSLVLIGAQRLLFGVYSVAMILGYRNLLHPTDDIAGAMADMTLWAVAMGAGFVLSAPFMPVLVHSVGMRRALTALMVGTAVVQVAPGMVINRWALLVAAFFIGLLGQSVKAGVDTVCQAHVEEAYKGRIFIVYDMIYNSLFVAGSAAAALVLPVTGLDHRHLAGLAAAYLAVGVAFWVTSGSHAPQFARGTALGEEPSS